MQTYHEYQYLNQLSALLSGGFPQEGRNGLTYGTFGAQMRFPLQDGFPLLTTKAVSFHNIATELMWFLRGGTNTRYLTDRKVHIWDEWADEKGDLGPIYGSQWRNFGAENPQQFENGSFAGGGYDQIAQVFEALKKDPNSRRHLVSAWNPVDVDKMALPPCHVLFQFKVQGKFLSLHLYQRSADIFLGVPYNIASYALLTHIFAHLLGLTAHMLIMSFGDLHLYATHVDQAQEQVKRLPYVAPRLIVNPLEDRTAPWEFEREDFSLSGYQHHPALKAEVSV